MPDPRKGDPSFMPDPSPVFYRLRMLVRELQEERAARERAERRVGDNERKAA